MMMRKLLVIGTALLATSLTGCDLYYGTPNTEGCDIWSCGDQALPPTGPTQPGGDCRIDTDCAAGCYCDADSAVCVETGFCELEADCPGDFTCDDRATCVPRLDDDCSRDGSCQPPPTGCTRNDDCGAGFECAADGTCIAVSCEEDLDCLAGCFCNVESGECIETGFCEADEDCMDIENEDGTFASAECDVERGTCVPSEAPTASCNEWITCEVGAPTCPADSTPAIVEGCYTGDCILRNECDTTPLALCDDIQNQSQCINRLDCRVQYDGYNCDCPGGGGNCDCTDPASMCTCETWVARCESV
jgi:predicted small secreted protein